MKRGFLPAVAAVLLIILLACAGCAGNKPAPVATLVPTTEAPAPTASPTPLVTATSEPVVTLPAKQDIDLSLTKDRVYSEIHLLYNGGGGEMFTTKIEMRVTSSDGKVADYVMSGGKKPGRGDEIVADGTRGSDRCEVWVTSGGVRYKVMDKSLMIAGAYEGN